jgi:phosphatidylserine/phosphatidylglycerophosphate/cardiolipin synthase-like enzyme
VVEAVIEKLREDGIDSPLTISSLEQRKPLRPEAYGGIHIEAGEEGSSTPPARAALGDEYSQPAATRSMELSYSLGRSASPADVELPQSADVFESILALAQTELRIATCVYSKRMVIDLIRKSGRRVCRRFLFALSPEDVERGLQTISAIKVISRDSRSNVKFLKGLHAKFLIADQRAALVTSAPLMGSGDRSNMEMHVLINEPGAVKEMASRFDALWSRAEGISMLELKRFEDYEKTRNPDKKPRPFGGRVGIP